MTTRTTAVSTALGRKLIGEGEDDDEEVDDDDDDDASINAFHQSLKM